MHSDIRKIKKTKLLFLLHIYIKWLKHISTTSLLKTGKSVIAKLDPAEAAAIEKKSQ